MLLYWTMLERSIERKQAIFDFGRSSPESPTFRFKKQWGAEPHAAVWSHYLRRGTAADMRPTNPKYGRAVRVWQRLPLWLTRLLGPHIVRGHSLTRHGSTEDTTQSHAGKARRGFFCSGRRGEDDGKIDLHQSSMWYYPIDA